MKERRVYCCDIRPAVQQRRERCRSSVRKEKARALKIRTRNFVTTGAYVNHKLTNGLLRYCRGAKQRNWACEQQHDTMCDTQPGGFQSSYSFSNSQVGAFFLSPITMVRAKRPVHSHIHSFPKMMAIVLFSIRLAQTSRRPLWPPRLAREAPYSNVGQFS